MLAGMKSLLEDKTFFDLNIKCGGEEFKVHKAVLASQSPVFRRMLESDMKEQRTNVIEISDVDQAVISDMLAYIYTGSAPNLDTLVRELLNVANKYELPGLLTMCKRELKLKINAENVIELLQLADLLDSSYLKKACLNYISLNSGAIRNSKEWKQLNKEEHTSDGNYGLLAQALKYFVLIVHTNFVRKAVASYVVVSDVNAHTRICMTQYLKVICSIRKL